MEQKNNLLTEIKDLFDGKTHKQSGLLGNTVFQETGITEKMKILGVIKNEITEILSKGSDNTFVNNVNTNKFTKDARKENSFVNFFKEVSSAHEMLKNLFDNFASASSYLKDKMNISLPHSEDFLKLLSQDTKSLAEIDKNIGDATKSLKENLPELFEHLKNKLKGKDISSTLGVKLTPNGFGGIEVLNPNDVNIFKSIGNFVDTNRGNLKELATRLNAIEVSK